MTDIPFIVAAVIAPCMTVSVVVLAAILNHSRLNDVNEVLRAEFRVLGKIEELERARR